MGFRMSHITDSAIPPPLSQHLSLGRCINCQAQIPEPWMTTQFDGQWTHVSQTECASCEDRRITAARAREKAALEAKLAAIKSRAS